MFKTKDGRLIDIEELTWGKARSILKPFHPELVEIINDLSPGSEYKLYKASYHFGTQILHRAEAHLPLADGGSISFNDPHLPEQIIKSLGYDPNISNPLGMAINKNCEFYLDLGQRIMPHMIIYPGEMFGLAKILSNVTHGASSTKSVSFMWNLIAGSRSTFLLSKINSNILHNKLKNFANLSVEKPQSYQDHWAIFKDIAEKSKSSWRAEVLYFSNKWFEKLHDREWTPVYKYLSQMYRLTNTIGHNILGWTATFSEIEHSKHLEHYSLHTLATAKHLFTIAANSAPGFRPAVDESSTPIKLIQDAYINGYGLSDSAPIIMEPAQFTLLTDNPVYYSLNYPTLAQFNPDTFKGRSIIALQDEVKHVTEKYQKAILSDMQSRPASLYNAAHRAAFSYYHKEPEKYQNIKDNILIPEEDHRFICEEGAFPAYSQFLTGCIKIAPNA